jgi:hypothetical protein
MAPSERTRRAPRCHAAYAAAAALAVSVLLAGCDPGAGGGAGKPDSAPTTDSAAAQEAVATYREALDEWSQRLTAEARRTRSYETKSGRTLWPDNLVPLLEEAPVLEEVEGATADGEYAYAAALAERVDGVVQELSAYQAISPGSDINVLAYDAYLDWYGRNLKSDSKYWDEWLALLTDGVVGRKEAAQMADRLAREVTAGRGIKRDYLRRVEALAGRTDEPLELSAVGYVASEIRWLIDFETDVIDHLAAEGADSATDAYQDWYEIESDRIVGATATTSWLQAPVYRVLPRYVRRLAALPDGSGALPDDAPTVADFYRTEILSEVRPVQKRTERRVGTVTDQLYLLWRIKELEDTPEDVYETARGLLVMQVSEDARSPYEPMFAVFKAYHETYPGADAAPPRTLRPWAEEMLAHPVPDLLEPYRRRYAALLDEAKLRDMGAFLRFRAQGEKVVTQATRAMDDPKRFVPAVRAAVEATRPTGSADPQ